MEGGPQGAYCLIKENIIMPQHDASSFNHRRVPAGRHPTTEEIRKKQSLPEKIASSGVDGAALPQCAPSPIKNNCEKWINAPGSPDVHIVLGRSMRDGCLQSTYGASDKAGEIRLICGLSPHKSRFNSDNSENHARPNAGVDAASLTLSQKCLPNEIGGIVLAGAPLASKPQSTVRAVADSVILVGDEYVKIVTRTKAKNSQNGLINQTGRIELIANNDDRDLQPMVKGNNLNDAMGDVYKNIHALAGEVESLLMWQMRLNEVLSNHFHITQWYATPDNPSEPLQTEGAANAINQLEETHRGIFNIRVNLLNSYNNYFSPVGDKYINSAYCYMT